MRRVGAVVVVLGLVLVASAVLMAAVPFSTTAASGGDLVEVDCGIPWTAWAGDDEDRCARLAQSRVDGAATVAVLGLVVMAVGFVARRRRPPDKRALRRRRGAGGRRAPRTKRVRVRPLPPI